MDEDEHRREEEAARRLIASWLADYDPSETVLPIDYRGGTGLAVPAADAPTVIGIARQLAIEGLEGASLPDPPAGLQLIAEALVVDEHPSAHSWTPEERVDLAQWVAVLVHRFGEDGVRRLSSRLSESG
ncbi:hypothetical protein [Kitasatospora sp. NE20-6]|uniref:hypothetical protein n=1 Tax=Kitasatospora sp. NE20-6 TaxID=2859066 RepID=UPI0038B32869